MDDCILSIFCTAFNHEKYIRKTLEGFVNQNTTYKYRVIVHDDASTDNTKAIIQEFVDRYPNLFIPIYQTENQYSKRVGIYRTFLAPYMTTKYSAMCEGDDYWCDPNKLQMQLDYMEQHPECSLCVHNTELINEDGTPKNIFLNETGINKHYTPEQIIEAGGGGLFHTSSFLYRTELRNKMPADFKIHQVGDYPLAMFLSMCGDVYYIGEVMSVYRIGSVNSWVKRTSSNPKLFDEHTQRELQDLDHLNEITQHKYSASFQKAQQRVQYRSLVKNGKFGKILRDRVMREFFNENSLKEKIKLVGKAVLKR